MEYNKELELYIDMDNTIYNLDKLVINIMNEELNMDYDWRENSNWWYSDTKISKKYFENLLQREGIFIQGDPILDSIEYINKLKQEGYKIKFLTLPQWDNSYCVQEKVRFLENHFDWFDKDKHLIMTGNKGLLCRKGENKILIDDSISNLDNWDGIKICKGTNCNKSYQGFRCEKWCEIYELIKLIEEGEK